MKALNRSLRISIMGLLIAFMSVGLTLETSIKKNSEYTKVLHFHTDYSFVELPPDDPYYREEPKPKWIYGRLPDELNSNLPNELTEEGYTMTTIHKRDFAELDSIFSSEPVEMGGVAKCMPVYRDILIFSKGKKVVKVVQLCFQCEQAHFVGPWENVSAFGQRGEYEKLKALLEK